MLGLGRASWARTFRVLRAHSDWGHAACGPVFYTKCRECVVQRNTVVGMGECRDGGHGVWGVARLLAE